jgi:hypothetical protein
MVPTCGERDQMIAVLVVPLTTPFRAVDCPPVKEVEVGLRVTVMVGTSATVALADLVGSSTLFAVITMFCEVLSVVGTVYTPPDVMVPTVGNIQVTAVLEAPETVAVNAAD